MLAVKNVSKRFEGDHETLLALEDVSFEVFPGETVMLVGPSGCGKSTILNMIAGLDTPSEGKILIDGTAIHGPGPDRSLVFQDGALFPWLSVRKNVEFGLKQAGAPRFERTSRALKALERVGLKGFETHAIHQLSGGMRQRVAIARALVLEPRVVLMDESFSALDAITREELYEVLQDLQRDTGATILFVTHNVREAVVLGDRVVLMKPRPGRVQETFPIEFERPRHIDDVTVARTAQRISNAMKGVPNPEEIVF
ncbi:ABC transporter ATP-binding protein [bacterium]|nr:MAG: ABC transporter ATP-binding protein [bacterium]